MSGEAASRSDTTSDFRDARSNSCARLWKPETMVLVLMNGGH